MDALRAIHPGWQAQHFIAIDFFVDNVAARSPRFSFVNVLLCIAMLTGLKYPKKYIILIWKFGSSIANGYRIYRNIILLVGSVLNHVGEALVSSPQNEP